VSTETYVIEQLRARLAEVEGELTAARARLEALKETCWRVFGQLATTRADIENAIAAATSGGEREGERG